jgi:death on curing protein
MSVRYLSPADLYAINEEVIGERPMVRDRHLLRSAANRPKTVLFGEMMYPSLLDKAAALLQSLAYHHLFHDGNKRTAARATTRFLRENGLEPTWDENEAYQFILEVAQNLHDVPEIAAWLKANTQSCEPPSPQP